MIRMMLTFNDNNAIINDTMAIIIFSQFTWINFAEHKRLHE